MLLFSLMTDIQGVQCARLNIEKSICSVFIQKKIYARLFFSRANASASKYFLIASKRYNAY